MAGTSTPTYQGDYMHFLTKLVLEARRDPLAISVSVRRSSDTSKHVTRGHDE
jgi:hypothetical protein